MVRSIIKSLHANVVGCSQSVRQIRANVLRWDEKIDAFVPRTKFKWGDLKQGRIEKDDVLSRATVVCDDDGKGLLVRGKGRCIDNRGESNFGTTICTINKLTTQSRGPIISYTTVKRCGKGTNSMF